MRIQVAPYRAPTERGAPCGAPHYTVNAVPNCNAATTHEQVVLQAACFTPVIPALTLEIYNPVRVSNSSAHLILLNTPASKRNAYLLNHQVNH